MTTSLSPVTESEMSAFFHGVEEFKHRIATGIVAYSEQVQRIDQLTLLVNDLRSQVQALTHTINQLTEDRAEAEAERDRAVASERVALDMAQQAELERSRMAADCNGMATAISSLQETKFQLEISNAELREQNDRQTLTLQSAIQDNQELLSKVDSLMLDRTNHSDLRNRLSNELSLAQHEISRLTNLLLGVKSIVDTTESPTRREAHAA